MPKLELGTLQLTIKVVNGEMVYNYPRLNVVQNNLNEVVPLIPDGIYRWTLTMDMESAEQLERDDEVERVVEDDFETEY